MRNCQLRLGADELVVLLNRRAASYVRAKATWGIFGMNHRAADVTGKLVTRQKNHVVTICCAYPWRKHMRSLCVKEHTHPHIPVSNSVVVSPSLDQSEGLLAFASSFLLFPSFYLASFGNNDEDDTIASHSPWLVCCRRVVDSIREAASLTYFL